METILELLPSFIAGLVPSMITAIPSVIALIKNINLTKAQAKMESLIQTAEFGLGAVASKLESLEKKYSEKQEFTIEEARNAVIDMKKVTEQLIKELRQDYDTRISNIESEMNKDVLEIHE